MIKFERKMFYVFVFSMMFMNFGCAKSNTLQIPSKEPVVSEPASDDKKELVTVDTATIGHTLLHRELDENNCFKPVIYKGGEMEIPYQVTFSGKVPYFGFLIYINGIPQPYYIKEEEKELAYIHQLELEEGVREFTFAFVPVTGKEGDTLEITVGSVFYPSFMPDMEKTAAYGYYHNFLPFTFRITYETDALQAEDIKKEKQFMKKVTISEETTSTELLEERGYDTDQAESTCLYDMYINGKLIDVSGSYDFKDGEDIHITYKIYGHPNYKCTNIACINHEPVSGDAGCLNEVIIKKGITTVIEMDLDSSELDDFSTFYMISVPENSMDYPDDVLPAYKTPSILLHREEVQ